METISFSNQKLPALVEEFTLRAREPKVFVVDFLNIHGFSLMLADVNFERAQRNVDSFVRDGVGLRLIGRFLPIEKLGIRIAGPCFFEAFLKANSNKKHLFLGGNPRTQQIFETRYGSRSNFEVVPVPFLDVYDGSIDDFAEKVLSTLIAFDADFVWLGLGCPKQNILAAALKPKLSRGVIFCVGAAFDYHVGTIRQCPRMIRWLGIESIWRLSLDPKKIGIRLVVSINILLRHISLWR